jgi:LPXTG-motif cell wall-anchored protein
MTVRKLFILSGLAVALVALSASAAFATYGGGDGGASVEPSKSEAGGTIHVVADGFMADSEVTITLHSDPVELGTATADADGVVDTTVTLPDNVEAGAHTIEVAGIDADGNPRVVTAVLEIEGSGGGSGSLPQTGAAILGLVGAGALLVTAGGVLTRARKRALSA